jgi:hypothetical protein
MVTAPLRTRYNSATQKSLEWLECALDPLFSADVRISLERLVIARCQDDTLYVEINEAAYLHLMDSYLKDPQPRSLH